MMRNAILNFAKQFAWQPQIYNGPVPEAAAYIVSGMGGSHLAVGILNTLEPNLPVTVWSDYAPEHVNYANTVVIASSYSGNTEEALSWLEKAITAHQPVVAISVGGRLLDLAKEHQIPYVQIPDTGIQPRSALGFSLLAMLRVLGREDLLRAAGSLSQILNPQSLETAGKSLAGRLQHKVPVIYASARNHSIAYNWKIKFNETGKIPAFYNIFPELNHNEMTGFDVKDSSRELSEKFFFIFLKDPGDHPQIQKRMAVTERLYRDRGLPVEQIELSGDTPMQRLFVSLLLADWTAFYTAEIYGLESEQVPMVEELKKLIT